MYINQQATEELNKLFPERSYESPSLTEKEQRVADCVNKMIIKGCNLWETTGKILSPIKTIYNTAWIPYIMLRAPLAHMYELDPSSAEKNLNTLANLTVFKISNSLITPGIHRQISWFSMSTDTMSKISNLALYAFPGALIVQPTYQACGCIMQGEWTFSGSLSQFWNVAGSCMSKSAEVYEGPEAAIRAATSLVFGAAGVIASQVLLNTLFRDWGQQSRFQEVDRVYTNVAMYLKNRWDEAIKNNNPDDKKYCLETATKLCTQLDVIEKFLPWVARLTKEQSSEIRLKLSWACNYVITQEKYHRETASYNTAPVA